MIYRIKQTSPLLYTVTLLLTIFFGLGIVIFLIASKLLPKVQTLTFVLLYLPFVILAFILPRYTATVDIEITLDEQGLKKRCLKQFVFCNNPDTEIDWSDIQDYIFEPERQFDKFNITLRAGTKFKFFHNNDYNRKDDFLKFLKDFENKVKEFNTNRPDNSIKKGKTIYETTWGLVLAGFAIIVIIGVPILLFALPVKIKPNYAGIGVVYLGAIFFLTQVIIYRLKN